ncbi:hypothetical protein [Azospirillum brasilense]|uniref:hypothetical protein n=1 Tax=Azospirillum brasilense TaxID=192 RepID=UPI0010C065B5|nr:hypothetical protein [Azospirillum brasilense]
MPAASRSSPLLDSAAFIDDTVASVLSQSGDFEIVYHVQDGGSRDGTLERLEHWQACLENGNFRSCAVGSG